MSNIKRNLRKLALGLAVAAFQSGTLQAQITLDPAWRVSGVDTNKPGFIWNYFSNTDGANTGNTIDEDRKRSGWTGHGCDGSLAPESGRPECRWRRDRGGGARESRQWSVAF